MKKFFPVTLTIAMLVFTSTACEKSGTSNNAITVENIAGTYALKALIWNYNGETINVYDSLDACEKDNLSRFNKDKTFDFIDAGITCTPPEDDNGTWDLKGDSLFFNGSSNPSKIESFDGKTLVLKGSPDGVPDIIATTTFEKQ